VGDEELRGLERELAATGTLEARLRIAAALSRAGRGDEAVRALLVASAEPAVRRELLRWPSWGTPHGDGTRYHPGPLPVRPRLRWSQTVRTSAGSGTLVASPLAIVWARGPTEQSIVFDPDTGRGLWWLDDASTASLRGTRVLLRGEGHGLRLVDVASRERLDQVEAVPDGPEAWKATFGSAVLDEDGAGYAHASGIGRVEAVRLEVGGRRVVWRRELPVCSAHVHGDLVLGHASGGENTTWALERATGATRWEAPGYVVAVDHEGVFLWEPLPPGSNAGALELRRRDGTVVWRRPGQGPTARACGPRVVVEARTVERTRTLHVIDRASGEERARLDDGRAGPGYLFQVADALLHWLDWGLLRACDHDGRERWRLQLDHHAITGSGPVAVTPGRLLVASADHLVCIDESP
jgi:hypothetical protein